MTRISFVIAVVCATTAPARADDQPWAVGVTDTAKARAQVALEAGNSLFLEKKYSEALAQYEQAVAAWNHPAIRFNMVRCLIQLDRPVEAADNLKQALAYGDAPFEEGLYQEAVNYEKLLANQTGDIHISCKQEGVQLTLDGQALGTCPTTVTRRVKPGAHQVLGRKAGYVPQTVETIVVGGDSETVTLELQSVEKSARIVHRWPTWVPWVVFGGGFAVAGVGLALELGAISAMNDYDEDIATNCSVNACSSETFEQFDELEQRRQSAELRAKIGVSIMSVGGAAIVTGAVMLYLNRGRSVVPTEIERAQPGVKVLPGGAAFTLSGRF